MAPLLNTVTLGITFPTHGLEWVDSNHSSEDTEKSECECFADGNALLGHHGGKLEVLQK